MAIIAATNQERNQNLDACTHTHRSCGGYRPRSNKSYVDALSKSSTSPYHSQHRHHHSNVGGVNELSRTSHDSYRYQYSGSSDVDDLAMIPTHSSHHKLSMTQQYHQQQRPHCYHPCYNHGNDELSMSSTHTSSSSLLSSSQHCSSSMPSSSSSTHSSNFSGSSFDDSGHYSLDYSNSSSGGNSLSTASSTSTAKFHHSYKKPVLPGRSKYVAMDCEMVGAKNGKSMCARVVLTNWKATIIYDSYVQPTESVDDYRTFISGITSKDLDGAPTIDVVRAEVEKILKGKILVGHGLENDLSSLQLAHPWWQIRDTAYYPPFQKLRTDPITGESYYVPRKLKDLCSSKLQHEIQVLGHAHSPKEDAIAALNLYKSHRPRWEACMTHQIQQMQRAAAAQRDFLTRHAMFEQQFL